MSYTANPGAGGDTFRSDVVSAEKQPFVKPVWGVTDVGNLPSVTTPFPVQGTIESGQMVHVGAVLTPKFAVIAASASGNNTLVASVSGKRIRVLAAVFNASGTVNAKFQAGASGTDLSGLFYMVANVGGVLPFNPVGWFETPVTTLLNLNLSAAIAVGGCLTYVEV
jgi:hypothetical protein